MSPYSPITTVVPYAGPVSNITPFTYRDGATYLEILESMRKYINTELVAYLNETLNEFATIWEAQIVELTAYVDAAIAAIGDDVAEAAASAAAAEAAAAAAEVFAGQAGQATDAQMFAVWNNVASQFRIALNAAYASKATQTTVETGRLSVATLDTRFNAKADDTDIDGINSAIVVINSELDAKAALSTQTTVETGRLSVSSIDARFATVPDTAESVKRSGDYARSTFDLLRDGMVTSTLNTRVVILGSSNANGAHVTKPAKAVFQRLCNRANGNRSVNLGALKALDTVNATPAPDGMSWWTGAQGNTTSADYFPTGRRTSLQWVTPHYVIHMIGENDYFYGTTIANYKTNMTGACEFIESVNPGVINVLVHSHGRNDVPTPVAPWSAYGQALKEVAEAKPGNRVFVDTTEFFATLGTMNDNRGTMIMDTVHLGDQGHRHMADIIGGKMGIPTETDYINGPYLWDMPIPATTATYTGTGTLLAEIWYGAAAYPREAKVEGSLWCNFSNAGGYIQVINVQTTPAGNQDSYGIKPHSTGATSMAISTSHYIAPNTVGSVKIVLNPSPGTVIVEGAGLSKAKITMYAV